MTTWTGVALLAPYRRGVCGYRLDDRLRSWRRSRVPCLAVGGVLQRRQRVHAFDLPHPVHGWMLGWCYDGTLTVPQVIELLLKEAA